MGCDAARQPAIAILADGDGNSMTKHKPVLKKSAASLDSKVVSVKQPKRGRSVRHPIDVRAKVREQQAVELRIAGLSYRAIGDKLGVSDVAAMYMVQRSLEHIETALAEKRPHLRQIELERLEKMHEILWKRVDRGELFLHDRLLKIAESRRKLLGLDAPTKIEGSEDGTPILLKLTKSDETL